MGDQNGQTELMRLRPLEDASRGLATSGIDSNSFNETVSVGTPSGSRTLCAMEYCACGAIAIRVLAHPGSYCHCLPVGGWSTNSASIGSKGGLSRSMAFHQFKRIDRGRPFRRVVKDTPGLVCLQARLTSLEC